MDELLDLSLKNINEQTRSRDIETQKHILVESIKELNVTKELVKEFTDLRNKAIINLYRFGITAKELSAATNISTVYIHRLVKGK